MSSDEPLLLIVSSPSGAGKTTLTSRLRQLVKGITFSVSHTTRKPRANEEDGREYHFVSRERFRELIEADAFLEWAEVHGNLYGTSKREIERAQDARGIIFDIDHQGARQIKSTSTRRGGGVHPAAQHGRARGAPARPRSEDEETVHRGASASRAKRSRTTGCSTTCS